MKGTSQNLPLGNQPMSILARTSNKRNYVYYSHLRSNQQEHRATSTLERVIKNIEDFHVTTTNSLLDTVRSKEKLLVLLSVIVLMIATATERITFKMTIDHMFPYKFVLMHIVYVMSCLVFAATTAYKLYKTDEITPQMTEFPHSKMFLMAVLDTVQFLILTSAAIGVSPTMTVLLVHTSTLVIVLGSKWLIPGRSYSTVHLTGVKFIGSAISLALARIIIGDVVTGNHTCIVSSCIYIIGAALQGLITLYKEKSITDWSRPINIYYLSSWLYFYQSFIVLGLGVVFYFFQGKQFM